MDSDEAGEKAAISISNKCKNTYNIVNIKMATPERFELPTLKVEASCSIQLSYEAIENGAE